MKFQNIILDYYKRHGRKLIWRTHITPYRVFVSEVMLQQTQVPRVEKKFPEFIKAFPDFESLAHAPTKKLLQVWQGMGYNRRALYLRDAAWIVVSTYNGRLPQEVSELTKLPGIGNETANSIIAFAWNRPAVFIETNIRRVYIHFFFPKKQKVDDKDIVPLVAKTKDRKNPRRWYYALMDYGTYLAKITKNPNMRSRHYQKQSQFKGSEREIRGILIKSILKKPQSMTELEQSTGFRKGRLYINLQKLQTEGFLMETKRKYRIK